MEADVRAPVDLEVPVHSAIRSTSASSRSSSSGSARSPASRSRRSRSPPDSRAPPTRRRPAAARRPLASGGRSVTNVPPPRPRERDQVAALDERRQGLAQRRAGDPELVGELRSAGSRLPGGQDPRADRGPEPLDRLLERRRRADGREYRLDHRVPLHDGEDTLRAATLRDASINPTRVRECSRKRSLPRAPSSTRGCSRVRGPPPHDLRDYGAVLSFGGAMHVDQEREHPWWGPRRRCSATCSTLGGSTPGRVPRGTVARRGGRRARAPCTRARDRLVRGQDDRGGSRDHCSALPPASTRWSGTATSSRCHRGRLLSRAASLSPGVSPRRGRLGDPVSRRGHA